MKLDAPLGLTHSTSSPPARALAPLVWALGAFVACTPAADDDDDIADASSSTDVPDPDPTESSESESTTIDAGEETAADGCWDQEGDLEGFDQDYGYPFEAFACAELPVPCDAVRVAFDDSPDCDAGTFPFDEGTLADREATEAAARCVLTAMRDGTPATHRIELAVFTSSSNATYTVLEGGVVAFEELREDNSGHATDRYLAPRDAAWFDACLAAPDLEGLVACFECDSPVGGSACIGEAPACP